MYIYTHVYMYVYMYVCMYVYVCTYIHMYVCMYVCMYASIRVSMYYIQTMHSHDCFTTTINKHYTTIHPALTINYNPFSCKSQAPILHLGHCLFLVGVTTYTLNKKNLTQET